MTFVALIRHPVVGVATDQWVLRADDVEALDSALAVGRRLSRLLDDSEQMLRAAKERAVDEGHAAGKAAGLNAAREEVATELTAMASAAHHQRLALQGSVARLAIQVVRKLAGEVGAPEMVAGLAQTAAADLLPGASLITLLVHPSVADAVKARLSAAQSARPNKPLHVEIRTDDAMDPFDCTLDTAFGTTIAGLDAQLGRLERVLRGESQITTPAEAGNRGEVPRDTGNAAREGKK